MPSRHLYEVARLRTEDAYALAWIAEFHLDGTRRRETMAEREARIAAAADPATTRRVVDRWAERQALADAHRRRLGAAAYRLGAEVAAHRVTVADAERRLTGLVSATLLPWSEARALVRDAYGQGLQPAVAAA